MDLYFQSLLVTAITALLVVLRHLATPSLFRRPVILSFVFVSGHLFLWSISELIHIYNFRHFGWPQRLFVVESLVIVPATFVFLKNYLGFPIRHRNLLKGLSLMWLLAMGMAVTVPGPWLVMVEELLPFVNFVSIAIILFRVYFKSRQSQNFFYREHSTLIILGIASVLVGFAINVFAVSLPWSVSVGHILLCALLYILSSSIRGNNLLSRVSLGIRWIHLSLMAMLLGLLYYALAFALEESPEWILFNTLIGSIVIVIFFEPFHQFSQSIFERIFLGRKRLALTRPLPEGGRDALLNHICQCVETLVPYECLALYVSQPLSTSFNQIKVVSVTDIPAPFPREISKHMHTALPSLNDPLFSADIRHILARLRLNDHQIETRSLQRWVDFLNHVHAQIYIPLKDRDEHIGFILLRGSALPTNRTVQRAIENFFRESARALHQLQIFERSSERERLYDLGLMAAGLAHELKNPLGAIHGASQILPTVREDSASFQEFIQLIHKETQRMNHLIHQILQFSHSKEDVTTLIPIPLDGFVKRLCQTIFADRPLMTITLDPQLTRFRLEGRPELLELVFSNLFQNLKDATTESSLMTLNCQIVSDSEQQPWLKIQISDNGRGMSREILDSIFVPYVTTKAHGSGIGMSLVKKAMDFHGARIHVTSQLGQGTQYSLFFSKFHEVQESERTHLRGHSHESQGTAAYPHR